MFSYQINKNIKLKILEEREAEQLFKLVDSNRDYLAEFLPLLNIRRRLKIVNTLSIRRCNNLSMVMDFIGEYGVIKN